MDKRVGLNAENCYRYSDDYEIACKTFEEAEQKIAQLERVLQEYGLALNHAKTKILELPQRLQDSWIGQFGRFDFDGDGIYRPHRQAAEIIRLFDIAFDITKQFPTSPSITYAIALLPGYRDNNHHLLSEENVNLVERYLAHAIVVEPGCLPKALRYLALISKIDEKVKSSSRIRESLGIVLRAGIAFGIDSDIVWSLCGHLLSGFSIPDDVNSEEAIKACRSIGRVALLACYLKGLWNINLDKLKEIVADSGIQSVDWLLIYELARHDICDVSKNKVKNSQEMKLLLDNGVSFFNLKLDMAAELLAIESAKSISYEEKVDPDYGF